MKTFFLFFTLVMTCMAANAHVNSSDFYHTFGDTTFVGADEDAKMNKYISELKEFDVDIKAPDGFRSIDMRSRRGFKSSIGLTVNSVGLENETCDAVILWPQLMGLGQEGLLRNGRYIEGDIRAHSGDRELDITPLIDVIYDKDMSEYANADTVVIYEYEFDAPFIGRYEHAVGVYLRKYAHPALLFKIALTDEGLKHKDEYIKTVLDNVNYGNTPAAGFVEAERESAGKIDLAFPSHYCRGGIKMTPTDGALLNNAVSDNGGREVLDRIWNYKRKHPMPNVTGQSSKSVRKDSIQLTPFEQYCKDLRSLDVRINMPEGFKEIDMRGRTRLDLLINPAYPSDEEIYPVAIESADAKAAFLFPQIDFKSRKQIIRKGHVVEDELRFNNKDLALDVRPLIEVIAAEDMSQYADADTVVIYSIEPNNLNRFLGYSHILGVYLRKYGHPAMLLKIAMNDEGLKHKDEYLRLLLENVKFGYRPFEGLILQEERLAGVKDLDFPSPQYKNDGFIITPVEQALFNIWENGGREDYRIMKKTEPAEN